MKRINPWFIVWVAAAGVAGALIGRNVARVSCVPVEQGAAGCDPGATEVVLAVIGAIVAMVGVGIVVALVMASLAEWRRTGRRGDDG
jgi:hypothetical protein